ncbi:hypothetical protein [Methylocella silvestris]|nr:hypothetical protein [Methylocella silvestris]
MTLAEFEAVARGFARFHGAKDEGEAPSDEDFYRDLADAMAQGRA